MHRYKLALRYTDRAMDIPMAKYSRQDVGALINRLEVRASVMEASAGRDLMAAALLLRLMITLGDIQEIETSPNRCGRNDGQRPS
jgi:hypothetical protein